MEFGDEGKDWAGKDCVGGWVVNPIVWGCCGLEVRGRYPGEFGSLWLAVSMDERVRLMRGYGSVFYEDSGGSGGA